jgi:hypothetical protein
MGVLALRPSLHGQLRCQSYQASPGPRFRIIVPQAPGQIWARQQVAHVHPTPQLGPFLWGPSQGS